MTHDNLSEIVRDFLKLIPEGEYSAREAAELTGVPHSTIAELRRGGQPRLHQSTRRRMLEFIGRPAANDTDVGKAVLLLAADRLERMAAELRAEAAGGTAPREKIEQAKRVASAVKSTRTPKPQKRAGRKGG